MIFSCGINFKWFYNTYLRIVDNVFWEARTLKGLRINPFNEQAFSLQMKKND